MLNEFRSTNITWDKATSRIYSPVTANASDENGRKLVVQIVNGGQVEDLTGATLHLYWVTRDKAHIGLDVFKAVDLKNGEFELSYTTGMLSNKGVLNANLVLVDTVGRVVSERFKITVTEGIDDDAIQSENSFTTLTQALIDIGNLGQDYTPILNDLTAQLQQTEQELTAQLAQTDKKTLGMPLAKMPRVEVTENYTGVLPITFHDGWLYGVQNNTTIVRSNNDGKNWNTVATSPQGSLHSMYWTKDGEVLLGFNSNILKSIGWSTNPQTTTWKTVVTKSKGLGILPWGIDGDGTKFIATEYSAADRSESRYVWISTDMGNTFNIVVDKFTIDPTNTSHMHGVCYDRWADRFFLSHGHGIIEGVYWSDDDGATWNLVNADFELDASPTTLTATDNGIVAGSDSGRAGLYGIQRTENPHDMVMRRTARWNVPREGVTGFAYRGVRDEETGQVFVAFKSDFGDISPVIMAGTSTTGSNVWEAEFGSSDSFQFLAIADKKVIGVHGVSGNFKRIVGNKPSAGTDSFDSGNIMTGKATSTSIAIGQNVDVKTSNEIVIGNNASLDPSSSNTENVVVGESAVGSSRSVALGGKAVATGAGDNIALGYSAINRASFSLAIGPKAEILSNQTGAIALGANSKARTGGTAVGYGAVTNPSSVNATAIGSGAQSGTEGVAIGRLASAGTKSVAIGLGAKGIHKSSVALGGGTETSSNDQVQIGKRHIELEVALTTGTPPIGNARVYLKVNAAGKQELCVQFRNAEVVLATQP